MATTTTLTRETLQQRLDLDVSTGTFTWKDAGPTKTRLNGKFAGRVMNKGYIQIKIDGKLYSAHRLVWLWVYGEFPPGMIDHVDGVRTNNVVSNLRVVTNQQNQQNQRIHRAGRLPGTRLRPTGKWEARTSEIHLGTFSTAEEAHAAYLRHINLKRAG